MLRSDEISEDLNALSEGIHKSLEIFKVIPTETLVDITHFNVLTQPRNKYNWHLLSQWKLTKSFTGNNSEKSANGFDLFKRQ